MRITIMMVLLHLVTLVCLLSSATHAARVLGIFPMAFKSHFAYSHTILKSLHAAGHHVTMISPFPPSVEGKLENFTYIDSRRDTFMYVGQSPIEAFESMSLNAIMEMTNAMDVEHCYNVMNLTEIQKVLNSPSTKFYDIMLVELVMAFECYLPLAERLNIPVVGTVSISSSKLADNVVGVPSNPMVGPSAFSGLGTSFVERARNLWAYFVVDYNYQTKTRRALEKFYGEFFGTERPARKEISLVFYNNHPSLLPRSLPPNVVDVGGIHIEPARPLPQDLHKFIEEAPQGVILFTFGTVVKASSLSLEKRRAFLDAFASIPQRVIWKFDETMDDLPKNVMISPWLPQRDILEHKNVLAFMSHCGVNGIYEAVFTGTPVVTIPILGDQITNAAVLLRRKVAVNLDLKTVTKEVVLQALNVIVNDTSYRRRMHALSRAFKDRPMTPRESIVYWTEYVMRHTAEEPYLKAVGTDMPLYQYLMLDIVAVFSVFASVATYMIYASVRACCRLIRKSKLTAVQAKKNQ